RNAAPAGGDPRLGAPIRRPAETRLVVQPGASEMVQMSWVAPPDLSPDSLAMAVLNRRLERLVRADDPPFISAAAYRDDEFHSAHVAIVQATAQPGEWSKALAATDQAVRQILAY